MSRVILVALVFLGCGEEPVGQREAVPADLASVLQRSGRATALTLDPKGQVLTLSYNPFAGGCVRLGAGTSATVNGEPLSAISLGSGYADAELGHDGDRCTRPSWAVQARASNEALTSFVVRDATTTLRGDYQFVYAQRTAAVVSPDGGVVHRGERLELAWTPSTDTPYVQTSNSFSMVFSLQLSDGGTQSWGAGDDPSSGAGRLAVDVPANARTGAGTLFLAGRFSFGVALCEPASLVCAGDGVTNGSTPGQVSVPLTIVP